MMLRQDIGYDLEGPISSQDNAQKVCKTYVKDGGKVFPVISRYDDLLTLENKEGYEPGDTLELIIPFLIEAGVTEDDIRVVSVEAGLVPGIAEFFTELQSRLSSVSIISTSYEQHALSIAKRVGISSERVFCTKLQLDVLRNCISEGELKLIREVREKVVGLYLDDLESGANDAAIKKLLDWFYWQNLPTTRFGEAAKMEVMGGRRKVKALQKAFPSFYLDNAFVVVDSITDFRMAQVVESAGGIALAWNANWYCLPWCSCGIAAVDARGVRPLFLAWQNGGRAAVRQFMESVPPPENPETGPYYHWLAGKDEKFQREMLAIHQRLRAASRGAETAKLG